MIAEKLHFQITFSLPSSSCLLKLPAFSHKAQPMRREEAELFLVYMVKHKKGIRRIALTSECLKFDLFKIELATRFSRCT